VKGRGGAGGGVAQAQDSSYRVRYSAEVGSIHPRDLYLHVPSLKVALESKLAAAESLQPLY
jgi:hypothetical protein